MMKQYDPVKVEHEVLKFWDKNKIYEKQKKTYASSKKRWSFYDGPITANNPMGVHHAWGRTYKDLYMRFKAMQRFNIRREPGFDCQGLWVEREVEKELGFTKGKDDIENFGIKNFVEACRKRTLKYVNKQTEQSIRLGMWMDWDKPYLTMSDKSNEYKWHFLKFCWDKGWLYKGKDVVPWCSRCTTASSKHDIVTEGYKEVTCTAVFVKFPVKGERNTYFLAWTTTPWSIPSIVALAVHPDYTYVKARQDGARYILVKDRAFVLGNNYEIEKELQGEELANLEFEMPYKDLPVQKSSHVAGSESKLASAPHKIILWNEVSKEDGTGVVTNAPGCGPEDYDLGKKHKLPAPSPLNDVGVFVEGYDWLTGKHVKEANQLIVEDLENRGFIYKTERYTHRYPHCFRCGEELVFRLVPEWYIAMDEIRPKLISENKKIKWYPARGKTYEEDWLKNMSDWLISRKRYWGLPLPIWECDCGETTVVGSLKELGKLAIKGFPPKELHRPWVDEVVIKCPKCEKPVHRTLDTGDVWLDAGMVPFFTLDYLTDKKYFEQWYPADFVTECGPGQYRCWFYAMILHGVVLTGKRPFENVLIHESVKDETGREMHKSWGNAIWFDDAAEKAGADMMRWLYMNSDPEKEVWFGYGPLSEKQKILNVLWNFGNYVQPYLKNKKSKNLTTADKWILSRLESVKKAVTDYLESLQPHLAAAEIENFFLNDLSRGYGQMIRENVEAPNVVWTVYNVCLELLKLMSPFVPFVAEKLYQELYSRSEKLQSIHLHEWPKTDKQFLNKELEEEMKLAQELISAVLSSREKLNRGIRWPLKSVTVTAEHSVLSKIKKHAELVKSMTNALELNFSDQLASTTYEVKPNFKVLGPKYGAAVQDIAGKLATHDSKTIVDSIEKGKYSVKLSSGRSVSLGKEDLIVRELESVEAVKCGPFSVYVDKEETDAMVASGFAREITRKVQDLRRKADLVKQDKIALTVALPAGLNLNKHLDEIKKKCGARSLKLASVRSKHKDTFELRGKTISVGFEVA